MSHDDIKTVLILGSGPIVIGQACEFDYSGTQACLALKEEGKRVVLVNSNPATIMTDPGIADRTFVEPLDPLTVVQIIKAEGIDAILPTMGGQTALNLMLSLSKIPGALEGVRVIGAHLKAIHLAEDRRAFREVVESLKCEVPRSNIIRSVEECEVFANEVGYPFILRPSFTLAGTGQSFVFHAEELKEKCVVALTESPIGEVLVEESVLGWKEFELEVMRDPLDNAIVVCSIENLDPMGVHTGDSITVAPAQTLTDKEYQAMRRDALRIVKTVGVETGGCNVQFAVHPQTGRRVVIEMNPRVSRSSALASKATGFPIAYVATKLALGKNLSDIDNQVTKITKACFEPTIDYVAVKIPRWDFEKFSGSTDQLLPQMQSVGEVLAIGSSFGEAYHKALNSLEQKWPSSDSKSMPPLKEAHSKRGFQIWDTLAKGATADEVASVTGWDPWFTREIKQFIQENNLHSKANVLSLEKKNNKAHYPMIDTCSGEMPAVTPFYYSTRDDLVRDEKLFDKLFPSPLKAGKKVVILGSGPNRIGQGVEFDYCCVHASQTLQRLGFETIMVNCNPETVSTDPRSSTRLYLDPLHADSVKDILERELDLKADNHFVLLQTGGQTPLKLSKKIEEWGYKILGSTQETIDLFEERSRFAKLLESLNIQYPPFRVAQSKEEALRAAKELGFPLLVRPSYVLGGRGMRICETDVDVEQTIEEALDVSEQHPVFIDKFLVGAVEFDVDGICDGKKAWIGGVMEHVEEAGIHSGDSACVIPPFRLPPSKIDEMAGIAKKIAIHSHTRGLFNVQMAVVNDQVFVIEGNPRASRTVPFLAKATGYPLIDWGMRAALGENVSDLTKEGNIPGNYRLPGHGFAVKMPVFPFSKFKGFDPILGPEMRSTGEVMGVDKAAGAAFAKAFLGAGISLPTYGRVLFSLRDSDKTKALNIVRLFEMLGFEIAGTPGTAEYLKRAGVEVVSISKIGQGNKDENLLACIRDQKIQLIVNTPGTRGSLKDGMSIRQAALRYRVPLLSTLSGAEMACLAIKAIKKGDIRPMALQDFVSPSI